MTEPFQMEPPEPSRESRPPRIVESTVSPQGHLLTLGTAALGTKDECSQTFTIARVIEEETAAEVHARLFIDYDPNKTLTAVRDQKLLPNETEPTSRLNLSFPVKASDFGRDSTKSTHLVEIVVSDGFADIAVFPPFRALQPAHESVSYAWFVTTDPTLSCPAP